MTSTDKRLFIACVYLYHLIWIRYRTFGHRNMVQMLHIIKLSISAAKYMNIWPKGLEIIWTEYTISWEWLPSVPLYGDSPPTDRHQRLAIAEPCDDDANISTSGTVFILILNGSFCTEARTCVTDVTICFPVDSLPLTLKELPFSSY